MQESRIEPSDSSLGFEVVRRTSFVRDGRGTREVFRPFGAHDAPPVGNPPLKQWAIFECPRRDRNRLGGFGVVEGRFPGSHEGSSARVLRVSSLRAALALRLQGCPAGKVPAQNRSAGFVWQSNPVPGGRRTQSDLAGQLFRRTTSIQISF